MSESRQSQQRSRRWALRRAASLAAGGLAGSLTSTAGAALDKVELGALLNTIDDRQRSVGDYRADVYLEAKEKGKETIAYNALVFRRQADGKFMILFLKPKSSQGQGYLRVDKNIWFYDPSVGKWERRTERERIGGTDSRRSDFDAPSLAKEYDAEYNGEEQLGAYSVHVLTLRGKPKLDLAFPVVKLWIDKKNKNILKRQDFALSGRLLRTAYFPKWKKVFSEEKNADVWYAQECRFYDEVEKENSTIIMIQSLDLRPLETNLFTKAWLEARSR